MNLFKTLLAVPLGYLTQWLAMNIGPILESTGGPGDRSA